MNKRLHNLRLDGRSWEFLLSIIFILVLSFRSPLLAQANNEDDDYDSIIVKAKDSQIKSKQLNRLMYRNSHEKIKENIYVIPIDTNNGALKNAKINQLRKSKFFEYIEPNYKLRLDEHPQERNYIKINKHIETNINTDSIQITNRQEITPNDKDFTSQYYLREINVTKAWNLSIGSEAITVGILDSGVDPEHPDLRGKIIDIPSLNGSDEIGHGTEVAGIIAANTNNNEGIAGIGWKTKILPIKITDEFGQAKVSRVVEALEEMYKRGVKIVQISLSTNQFSQTLKNAIKEAQDRGILIISTGGNTGIKEIRYPAAFNDVIGVGAIDQTRTKESYSTTGEHISLVAPGTTILTTTSGSTYTTVNGTSFAAPQITGAAALVWSLDPDLTNNEIRDILIQSVIDLGEAGKDIEYGYGLLNTEKALEMAKEKLVTPRYQNH